jgi:hypothetical protein
VGKRYKVKVMPWHACQARRGDGGIAPNHLQSWRWNSVGCWPAIPSCCMMGKTYP